MNKNFDNIPAEVFDWMQNCSFNKLDAQQQDIVKHYFSIEEYDDLHLATIGISNSLMVAESADDEIKSNLMARFNKHHHPKQKSIKLQKPLIYWQAAAMLLLILSIWLFNKNFGLQNLKNASQLLLTDTVYVDRLVSQAPVVLHDTVYRYKYIKTETNHQDEVNDVHNLPLTQPEHNYENIPAMRIKELGNATNITKGNSMKDDSLLKKYNFVSM